MRSARWAEWIIARLTDRSRAVSIVGDLLETTVQGRPSSFWLCFAGIVFSLIWRRTIAFVAAFFVGAFWRVFAILAFYNAGYRGPRLHQWDPWEPLFSVIWFGTVLGIAATYTAIRYGLRDKFAQIALGFSGLITIVLFYRWTAIVAVACIVLALSILIVSVRSERGRRALVALTAALVVGFGGSFLSLYLMGVLVDLFNYPGARYDLMFSLAYLCFLAFFLWAAWMITTACARMHDRLLRSDQTHGD